MTRSRLSRTVLSTAAALGAGLALAGAAPAAQFTNGSFERPGFVPDGDRTELFGGITFITGWTVTGSSIDYLHNFPGLPPSDGEYNLDLNGSRPGGVEQTFTTIPGASYTVTFDLSFNGGCGQPSGALTVLTDTDFNIYPATPGTPVTRTYDFVDDGDGSTTLSFVADAQNTSCGGPVLDNVRVSIDGAGTLDSRAPSKATKPVFTSDPLASGREYEVTIRGTSSSWDRTIMAPDGQRTRNWVVCGSPLDAPLIASPGTNGRVGEDPAFLFALPQTGTRCNPKFRTLLPYKQSGLRFDLDGSGTFATVPVPDGNPSTPSTEHSYTYTVVGQGQPLKIRFADNSPKDNSGQYEIVVVDRHPIDA